MATASKSGWRSSQFSWARSKAVATPWPWLAGSTARPLSSARRALAKALRTSPSSKDSQDGAFLGTISMVEWPRVSPFAMAKNTVLDVVGLMMVWDTWWSGS